jgi:uncharacterized protein (DUF302 family)
LSRVAGEVKRKAIAHTANPAAPTSCGLRRVLDRSYADALARVPEVLASEGFGVLTEIDVRETLKQKLDVDFRRYKILGTCNPPLAHRALEADLEVGLMLPCNVIVYEGDDGRAVVVAVDPMLTVAARSNPETARVAEAVRAKLERALDRL